MKQRKPKQLEFEKVGGWGGKRVGAGRPNRSHQVNHMKRPRVSLKTPLHLTLRLQSKLPTLRKRELLREFRKSIQAARRLGLYVIHFSIQSNHIHLFAEAQSRKALASGMKALAGRFAKFVRAFASAGACGEVSEKGGVFSGRYHLRVLKTPTEVRNALEYVLLNLSKHQRLIEYIDGYSSGTRFTNWPKLLGRGFTALIRNDVQVWQEHLAENPNEDGLHNILSPPRSWLASTGWTKACV